MAEEGAAWIDVGGESTRPGATVVPEDEEKARVLPVIAGLKSQLAAGVRISIDTYKAGTARAALAAGATVVNDVSGGLLDPAILGVAAEAGAAIVLGHLRGAPSTMMEEIVFDDVVDEVGAELEERIAAARRAGCGEIWADPGIGFGKRIEHNLALLRAIPALRRAARRAVAGRRVAQVVHRTARPASRRRSGSSGRQRRWRPPCCAARRRCGFTTSARCATSWRRGGPAP